MEDDASKRLSLDQQLAILRRVAQLADEGERYSDLLREAGFSAFQPWQDFKSSFCTPDQRTTHRQYVIEEAKLKIGTPSGIPGHMARLNPEGYRSAFIEALRAKRDKVNGASFHEFQGPAWLRELDPCECRRMWYVYNDESAHTRARAEMAARHKQLRELEASLHKSDMGQKYDNSTKEWSAFFSDALNKYFSPFGFVPDVKRSSSRLPVYMKKINSIWDICITLQSDQKWADRGFSYSEERGIYKMVDMDLSVRCGNAKKATYIAAGVRPDIMPLRFQHIVEGFGWAYGYFINIDDWESVVKSHATFYGMIECYVLSILCRELPG